MPRQKDVPRCCIKSLYLVELAILFLLELRLGLFCTLQGMEMAGEGGGGGGRGPEMVLIQRNQTRSCRAFSPGASWVTLTRVLVQRWITALGIMLSLPNKQGKPRGAQPALSCLHPSQEGLQNLRSCQVPVVPALKEQQNWRGKIVSFRICLTFAAKTMKY